MRFFHIASNKNAEAIFKDGFRDGTGYYLTDRLWKGVFVGKPQNKRTLGDSKVLLRA